MQKVLVLHDFMLKDSNLKGSKLLVYAFIYSYSQIPNSKYCVYWKNAIKFLGISKSSYFDSIEWLVSNHYITAGDFYPVDDMPITIIQDNINLQKYKEMTNEQLIKIAQSKWVK